MVNHNTETPSFLTVAKANHWLKSHRPENKTILVKGSRGIMLEEVLKIL
jgi:UDP-N-acetylmuramyl pentapeptide synthase